MSATTVTDLAQPRRHGGKVKPAFEPQPGADDLLRASACWVAAALAQEMAPVLAAIRANAQAAQRLLNDHGSGNSPTGAVLATLLADTDRLGRSIEELAGASTEATSRGRVDPELEIASALTLLRGPSPQLVVESASLAPRVTGWPGLIGAAILHLLLSVPPSADQTVRVSRPRADRLRVEIQAAGSAAQQPTTSLHTAAANAACQRMGGRIDLDVDGNHAVEIPLELG